MRLVFLGTPQIAVGPLLALHEAGHEILHVVSGPDRRRGRGGRTSPSPVKAAALELGLTVGTEPEEVLGRGAELGVVVAFGRLVPASVLDEVPMVNLHFSLLPRWRGAAPVERAILAGDDRTGVCLMALERGLDTGGVYARAELALDDEMDAEQVRNRLGELGTELLVEALDLGLGPPEPQAGEGVTYAEKLGPEDRHLDFVGSAQQVRRVIRVGGAWTTLDGARLKVLEASPVSAVEGSVPAAGEIGPGLVVGCGDGEGITLLRVQPEGRPAMAASDWANGARPIGRRLGS